MAAPKMAPKADESTRWLSQGYKKYYKVSNSPQKDIIFSNYSLVGGLEHFLFFHILGTKIPFD